ncbi:MAG: epoxyqueuosine reductase [Dysgonomonas sp.]|nr:epoxyqueuosine reductase [Dysgonomonas sp.]
MSINNKIIHELESHSVDFIRFVNISELPFKQNRGFSTAILFGIALSPAYVQRVIDTPQYVQDRIDNNFDFDDDELFLTEKKTDHISDCITQYLINMGYDACSQSDASLISSGVFDGMYKKTPLPHKTIAIMAGLGWIGKNNLLVTPEYGSALCLGTVLSNAPFVCQGVSAVASQCLHCSVCTDICNVLALKGKIWEKGVTREEIIDVFECTTCMKCLAFCIWTRSYINKSKEV